MFLKRYKIYFSKLVKIRQENTFLHGSKTYCRRLQYVGSYSNVLMQLHSYLRIRYSTFLAVLYVSIQYIFALSTSADLLILPNFNDRLSKYSGDLNNGLVRYSNGPNMSDRLMVCYSSHGLNTDQKVCNSSHGLNTDQKVCNSSHDLNTGLFVRHSGHRLRDS